MENNIVVIKNKHYKFVSNLDVQLAEDLSMLPPHQNIVLVTSFYVNTIAKELLEREKNVVHIFPSVACLFCFNTNDILYIQIEEKDDVLCCLAEIVLNRKYLKQKTKIWNGNLDFIINELCLLVCDVNKSVLCENIYVDGTSEIKKVMEERVMMELGKGIDVKYMKFLKVKDEIRSSEYCHNGILDDPVSIGGLIASEIFYSKNIQYMTKEEYKNGDYSKLSPFD